MLKYNEELANSLAESWINGNRSWVFEQLGEHNSDFRALYTAEVVALLFSMLGNHGITIFLHMLRNRIVE